MSSELAAGVLDDGAIGTDLPPEGQEISVIGPQEEMCGVPPATPARAMSHTQRSTGRTHATAGAEDPYAELERYLEQAKAEISEMCARLQNPPEAGIDDVILRQTNQRDKIPQLAADVPRVAVKPKLAKVPRRHVGFPCESADPRLRSDVNDNVPKPRQTLVGADKDMYDSLSDDMSLLEELSVYDDSHDQDEEEEDEEEEEEMEERVKFRLHPEKLKISTCSLPSSGRNVTLHHKFRSHQSAIDAKRRQFFLPLEQEPFQPVKSNITELPSPSSTSLHSGYHRLISEDLGIKSNSAPLLMKNEEIDLSGRRNLRYSRSQSDRHLAGLAARNVRPALDVQLKKMKNQSRRELCDVDLPCVTARHTDVRRHARMHRRMSSIREYKFFRSFSAKIENWHIRKAESLWKKMRERKIAEIEAIEACRWLRAAGFPQYAQMYEDNRFPIEINDVAKDHPFLENDPLQSLYRRLQILNRCANMHIDAHQHTSQHSQREDSDDDSCALSEAWTFQHNSRRWSRVDDAIGLVSVINNKQKANKDITKLDETDSTEDSVKSSPSGTAQQTVTDGTVTLTVTSDTESQDDGGVRLRRTGSERLKDGAKALLRRVESIKSRRRKRQNRDGLVIFGPQSSMLSPSHGIDDSKHIDVLSFSNPSSPRPSVAMLRFDSEGDRKNLFIPKETANLLSPYGTPASATHGGDSKKDNRRSNSNMANPVHFFLQLQEARSGDDSSSICSDDSQELNGNRCTGRQKVDTKKNTRVQKPARALLAVEDCGTLSDSEYHSKQRRTQVSRDLNEPGTNTLQVSKLQRGGSLNLGKASKRQRDAFSNRSMRVAKAGDDKSADDKKRPSVARWHSFQQPKVSDIPVNSVVSMKTGDSFDSKEFIEGTKVNEMSCGQLLVVRKLGLVTLTGYMERYCPTHRSGWNWDLPKFIKRIKTPDYKDKRVFGTPLVLNLQRYGNTLPSVIAMALAWLEDNALDQVGLFRKPGVKSRIAKLKSTIESTNNVGFAKSTFDEYHAYDVADLVKQYFRELPDPLLTTKLSETFLAICQYLPDDVRADAIQSAILLLPDEHREVLYTLLSFFDKVVATSSCNQMTANNLAVCWAPSLFYLLSGSRSHIASPRRKKATGTPDEKELSETRASHDCLAYLLKHYRALWTISSDRMRKCSFNYMEESKPVPLEMLGIELHLQNWRGYLAESTKACLREGRERPRGWVSLTSADPQVAIFFKKVGDGHPLRLWKCITEVEAPPFEVTDHILSERHLWDNHMLQWKTVEQIDDETDIFQYACGQPVTDYCVLRQWSRDQLRGAYVIVEVSITHRYAQPMLGGVRGVVLASRYLIEPCGGGKCKVMHLSRVDMKGRTPDWYNKNYGHICQQYLSKIKTFFEHCTEGPESKV